MYGKFIKFSTDLMQFWEGQQQLLFSVWTTMSRWAVLGAWPTDAY